MKWPAVVLVTACGKSAGITDANLPPSDAGLAPASLALTPPSADLGSVSVGVKSPSARFTLSNTGGSPTTPLEISVKPDFQIVASTCSGALAAAATCTIDVVFDTTIIGSQSTTLLVAASSLSAMATLTASAHPNDDIISMTPSGHAFGSVAITQTASQTFTITDIGSTPKGPIALSFFGADPTQFSLANDQCSAQTIAPSATCTFDVVFAPTALGTKDVSVEATASNTVSADLSGIATPPPPLTVSPGSYDFGSIALGTTSANVAFTIANTTTTPFTALGFGTTDPAFVVTSTTCEATLAANASCSAYVDFAPTATPGAISAQLAVMASGYAASSALSGTAVP